MARIMDSISNVLPDELEIAVSMGQVDGWRNFSAWNENDSVSTTQEEMSNVSGIRVLPTSGGQITIASSNANDTSDGTGARTLLIDYLDSNMDHKQEIITLNGTTNVLSTETDAYRFRAARVLTVGSTLASVGNITISMGGNAQAVINATQNESRETGYAVPNGYRFISTNAVIATGRAGNVDIDVAFEYRLPGSDVWITLRSLQVFQQVTPFSVVGVAALPPGTDLRVLARATGGSGPTTYVQIRGYEIEERFFQS